MRKKILLFLLGCLVVVPVIAALIGIKLSQFQALAEAGAQFVMPPEVVNAIAVRKDQWQPRVAVVGSVVAVNGAMVSTEVDGVVRAIRFESGAEVKAGDELLRLDSDLEEVQLREAEVAVAATRRTFQRAEELSRSRNISNEDFDLAETNASRAQAQVDFWRTQIAKKTLRAPFSGHLGLRAISIGQYLPRGSAVVSLHSLDPVHVEFSVPQHQVAVLAEGLQVEVRADAFPDLVFAGKVTAVTPDVDVTTRSIRVQATLANPGLRLRPGMSVAVELVLAAARPVLLIPVTAVAHGPYGDTVFVIEEEGSPGSATGAPEGGDADAGQTVSGAAVASQDGRSLDREGTASQAKTPTAPQSAEPPALILREQPVRLGARRGDFVVVDEGLAEGEQVVSTGVFKLRPGTRVVIDNRLAPEFSLTPRPGNS